MHPPRDDTNSPSRTAVLTRPSGGVRYTQPIRSLRPCRHGHGARLARATHAGMSNGVALTVGCEDHMRQWVVNRTDG